MSHSPMDALSMITSRAVEACDAQTHTVMQMQRAPLTDTHHTGHRHTYWVSPYHMDCHTGVARDTQTHSCGYAETQLYTDR